MIKSTLHALAVLLIGTSLAAGAAAQQPASSQDGLPLVFHDDFSDGDMQEWEPTDPAAWEVVQQNGNQMMALVGESDYEPPVRSPHNYALIKDLWVSDFILEARVKSTSEQYGHRDICFFYGWQDPSHFYYTHLAPAPDPHAHSVFLVNEEPRVSIADERSDGVDWGDEFHTVRIVRDADAGTIEVYFDDMTEPIMRAEDTHFEYGRLGLGTFDDTGLYDDVKVWGERVENPDLSDAEILEMYDGLRVADVSDGMDVVGLRDVGLMSTEIQPLWRDVDEFDHMFQGIAVTARYVPTNRVVPNPMPPERFSEWEGEWYSQVSSEPFVEELEEGSAVVIDASGNDDTGSIGSYNALFWISKGAEGIVTTGGVRDTDEIIKEEIPAYFDPEKRGRGIRPGRNEIESVNEPVEVGGVLVRPGDVVVADGDGVIVVPRQYAVPVARAARQVLESDKEARRALYEQLGRPLDRTVRSSEASQ